MVGNRGCLEGVSKERPLKQFIARKSKSAGRNSKFRIVERIEYDPNRTSRIAVVRWEEKGNVYRKNNFDFAERTLPPRMLTSPTMPMKGQFNFSSLPGMTESRKVVSSGPKTGHVVVGLPNGLGVPRMALAGSRPDFFVPRYKDVVLDTERLTSDDEIGLGFAGACGYKDSKLKAVYKAIGKEHLIGKFTSERAPVTYILATNQMKAGQMVLLKPSARRDHLSNSFITGKRKSDGRNSKGRITIFHRGGGAKRSQRTIDLKRNTSSVGIVERIEYDPNRTSRIAVVRWEEKGNVDRKNNFDFAKRTLPPRVNLTHHANERSV
ncbi:ribosomal protein L2 [Tanacetum coccineum]